MSKAFFECESVKLGLRLPFLQNGIHISLRSSYTLQTRAPKMLSNIVLFLTNILTLKLIKVFLHKNIPTAYSCNMFCCNLKYVAQGCSQSCERSHLACGPSFDPPLTYTFLFVLQTTVHWPERARVLC